MKKLKQFKKQDFGNKLDIALTEFANTRDTTLLAKKVTKAYAVEKEIPLSLAQKHTYYPDTALPDGLFQVRATNVLQTAATLEQQLNASDKIEFGTAANSDNWGRHLWGKNDINAAQNFVNKLQNLAQHLQKVAQETAEYITEMQPDVPHKTL